MVDEKTEPTLQIPIVEEHHQAVVRRVMAPEAACCAEFEEEYGKEFRLLPDGSLAPAAVLIERQKMGKTVMDKPKTGWRACPFCGTRFTAATQVVVKTSSGG